ncbi:MAG: NAD-dependent epimerase/dehydratase family protein [Deltaproteobacteria bacterium]|nr:NAD-dependent epimerase/dehydratase family protein [Deltaproteobacteria bacterium]
MTKKYLVTGGTGFLGRHLLEILQKKYPDAKPIILVRDKKSWNDCEWTKGLKVELLEGTFLSREPWHNDPRLKGLDGIFHLGAQVEHARDHAEEIFDTNVEGTLQMVCLADEYKCRLVFVSTSGTVGCFRSPKESADEEAPYAEKEVKRWPYYYSKILAEQKGRALAQEFGVSLVVIRPPIMLGPGDHRGRSTAIVDKIMKGQVPFLLAGGYHFIDIRDAACAIVQAMQIPNPKPVYHLCGKVCTLEEFFQMLATLGGKPPKKKLSTNMAWFVSSAAKPLFHLFGKKSPLPDPVLVEMASHYWGTHSRYAEKDLNFHARDPMETLKDTVGVSLRSR